MYRASYSHISLTVRTLDQAVIDLATILISYDVPNEVMCVTQIGPIRV